jgi:hypothetical protein
MKDFRSYFVGFPIICHITNLVTLEQEESPSVVGFSILFQKIKKYNECWPESMTQANQKTIKKIPFFKFYWDGMIKQLCSRCRYANVH